ncbi:MAG: putative DNA-binding domain-containing protein [Candidatus Korobacteraceae bacterium]
MTALLEFQRAVARAVMQPMSSRNYIKRGGADRRTRDGVALVKPNSRLSSLERLEIYNRSYWSRVLDALGEDFLGVRAVVGAKGFEQIRRRYLDDCPSESFTMRNLGRHLSAWMERNRAVVGANYEIALDMARLEWAEIESFDAAEHERLGPAEIAAMGPASTLHLQPHLQTMQAGYEVDTLLLEVRNSIKRRGSAVRAVTQTRIARARAMDPVYLAIHRHELVVHYKRLDGEMFRLLQMLGQGATIGDAVESAYADSALSAEQCRQHVQDSFAMFGALGWFCN